jgi:hypothetical protein
VHHGAGEGAVAAVQLDDVAAGGDEFQAGDGGGQVLVGPARAVGAGRAGPGDRDVRQRGQVAQREAGAVQPAGEAAESTSTSGGSPARLTWAPGESAMSLKEWPVPSTRTWRARATTARSSPTEAGR